MTDDRAPPPAEWFEAFPLPQATRAVDALCKGWDILVTRPRSFHAKLSEPKLTKALKIYVERVAAREAGLLGMWAAENVIGTMNLQTGQVTEERRTDITYGWNDTKSKMQIVFEFKKLTRYAKSRKAYVGAGGLGRFVTGIYGEGQPVAAMVGILVDPHSKVVPPLIVALEDKKMSANLLCVSQNGKVCHVPSIFGKAEFDTAHQRPPELAPPHGMIRVAHFFLSFP